MFPSRAAWLGLIGARLAVGLALVLVLPPVSVDDAFRVFHALWWFDHPAFAPSHFWPPGYFWAYGLVAGLARDGLLAPRLFTLALHLAACTAFLLCRTETPFVRFLAAVWFAAAPLSLALGAVPLSETLFALCVVSGVSLLAGFLESGRAPALLAASACMLAASTVRYEAWTLLPVFTAFAWSRRPEGSNRAISVALGLVPWIFPAVWVTVLGAVEGRPLLFLRSIATDTFGPGDLWKGLAAPASGAIALQPALAAAVLAASGIALVRRRIALRSLVWEAHLAASIVATVYLVAVSDVPSQLPVRMLYPAVILGAVPIARWVAGTVQARLHAFAAALLAVALLGPGLAWAWMLPGGGDTASQEAGDAVAAAYDSGTLGPADRVIVDRRLPEGAEVVVHANRPGLVRIDAMGSDLPASLLDCSPGRRPAWAEDVRMVVAFRREVSERLDRAGWRRVHRVGPYTLHLRPPGAMPAGICPAP